MEFCSIAKQGLSDEERRYAPLTDGRSPAEGQSVGRRATERRADLPAETSQVHGGQGHAHRTLTQPRIQTMYTINNLSPSNLK